MVVIIFNFDPCCRSSSSSLVHNELMETLYIISYHSPNKVQVGGGFSSSSALCRGRELGYVLLIFKTTSPIIYQSGHPLNLVSRWGFNGDTTRPPWDLYKNLNIANPNCRLPAAF